MHAICICTLCRPTVYSSLYSLTVRSLDSALMVELHAVCQETMIVNIEGESRLEKKNIELSALRNEYVTLMSSEGGLKEVQKYRKFNSDLFSLHFQSLSICQLCSPSLIMVKVYRHTCNAKLKLLT